MSLAMLGLYAVLLDPSKTTIEVAGISLPREFLGVAVLVAMIAVRQSHHHALALLESHCARLAPDHLVNLIYEAETDPSMLSLFARTPGRLGNLLDFLRLSVLTTSWALLVGITAYHVKIASPPADKILLSLWLAFLIQGMLMYFHRPTIPQIHKSVWPARGANILGLAVGFAALIAVGKIW